MARLLIANRRDFGILVRLECLGHRLDAVEVDVRGDLHACIVMADDGFEDVFRKGSADARDAVPDILGGDVNVAGKIELDGDGAGAFAAFAAERFYAFDVVDLLLESLGQFGLDDLRVCAGINGGDADNGWVNVRQLAHRQAR